jgi:hypothetical protein
MIGPAAWHDRSVSSVVSRVLVGLGVAVAALVAIGYAFIFSGIATPVATDLGTVSVPDADGAVPVYLSDGRPAFVVRSADRVTVLDARVPVAYGEPGRLIAWCNGLFTDLVGTSAYAPDGGLLGGDVPTGLIVYPTRGQEDGQAVTVGAGGQPAASRIGEEAHHECDSADAVTHTPNRDEVFDPSVAAEQEPPGWVWMEGRLMAVGGQALLCDGDTDCAAGAVARGIDPAKVDVDGVEFEGLFIGRIRDDAIDELYYVPQAEDGR